jgi:PAS domain-containing protein
VRYWNPVNVPVLGPDGEVQFIIHRLEDVTEAVLLKQRQERAHEEEALRHRSEELTDFIENATVGLHWVGPDGTILCANQAELDLLGYNREEYIGNYIL